MTIPIKTGNSYSTRDLALAAALSIWFPIEEIDKTNPKRAEFLFERCSSLDQILETYWRRELKVEPQAYFHQLKIIKSRLYEKNYG